jgi:hypothetical protein
MCVPVRLAPTLDPTRLLEVRVSDSPSCSLLHNAFWAAKLGLAVPPWGNDPEQRPRTGELCLPQARASPTSI